MILCRGPVLLRVPHRPAHARPPERRRRVHPGRSGAPAHRQGARAIRRRASPVLAAPRSCWALNRSTLWSRMRKLGIPLTSLLLARHSGLAHTRSVISARRCVDSYRAPGASLTFRHVAEHAQHDPQPLLTFGRTDSARSVLVDKSSPVANCLPTVTWRCAATGKLAAGSLCSGRRRESLARITPERRTMRNIRSCIVLVIVRSRRWRGRSDRVAGDRRTRVGRRTTGSADRTGALRTGHRPHAGHDRSAEGASVLRPGPAPALRLQPPGGAPRLRGGRAAGPIAGDGLLGPGDGAGGEPQCADAGRKRASSRSRRPSRRAPAPRPRRRRASGRWSRRWRPGWPPIPAAPRPPLDLAYADGDGERRRRRIRAIPNVLTLYADAVMNTMPWDYWQKDGIARSRSSHRRRRRSSGRSALHPDHAGAHHYYIHLWRRRARRSAPSRAPTDWAR